MKVQISAIVNGEKQYLEKLYPVQWTTYISSSLQFNSIEESKEQLKSRYTSIIESICNPLIDIEIICIDNGQIVYKEKYI